MPTGSTILQEADRLLVLGDDDSIDRLRDQLDSPPDVDSTDEVGLRRGT